MASTPTGIYDARNMQPLPTPRTLDLMVVLGGGARDNIWIKDPNKMTIEERRHFDDEVVARAKLIREMKMSPAAVLDIASRPRAPEPPRPRSRWDYLLDEAKWYATDVLQERRWKRNAACALAWEAAQSDAKAKLRRVPDSVRAGYRDGLTLDDPACAEPLTMQPVLAAPPSARGRAPSKKGASHELVFSARRPDRPEADYTMDDREGGPPTPPADYSKLIWSFGINEGVVESLLVEIVGSEALRVHRYEDEMSDYAARLEDARRAVETARVAAEAEAREAAGLGDEEGDSLFRFKKGLAGKKKRGELDEYGHGGGSPPRKKMAPAPKLQRGAGGAAPTISGTIDSEDGEMAYLSRKNNRRRMGRDGADEDDASTYSPTEDLRQLGKAPKLPRPPKPPAPKKPPPSRGGQRAPQAPGARGAPGRPGTGYHPLLQWTKEEDQLLLAIVQEFSGGGVNWWLVADIINTTHHMTGTYRRHAHCQARWRQLATPEGAPPDQAQREVSLESTLNSLRINKGMAREIMARELPISEQNLKGRVDALAELARSGRQQREERRDVIRKERHQPPPAHESHAKVRESAASYFSGMGVALDPLAILDMERNFSNMQLQPGQNGKGQGQAGGPQQQQQAAAAAAGGAAQGLDSGHGGMQPPPGGPMGLPLAPPPGGQQMMGPGPGALPSPQLPPGMQLPPPLPAGAGGLQPPPPVPGMQGRPPMGLGGEGQQGLPSASPPSQGFGAQAPQQGAPGAYPPPGMTPAQVQALAQRRAAAAGQSMPPAPPGGMTPQQLANFNLMRQQQAAAAAMAAGQAGVPPGVQAGPQGAMGPGGGMPPAGAPGVPGGGPAPSPTSAAAAAAQAAQASMTTRNSARQGGRQGGQMSPGGQGAAAPGLPPPGAPRPGQPPGMPGLPPNLAALKPLGMPGQPPGPTPAGLPGQPPGAQGPPPQGPVGRSGTPGAQGPGPQGFPATGMPPGAPGGPQALATAAAKAAAASGGFPQPGGPGMPPGGAAAGYPPNAAQQQQQQLAQAQAQAQARAAQAAPGAQQTQQLSAAQQQQVYIRQVHNYYQQTNKFPADCPPQIVAYLQQMYAKASQQQQARQQQGGQ